MTKEWYRHATTGDRGWLEVRDGVEVIVYDRPQQEKTRKFNERDWIPDRDHRPLNRMAIAQTAFAADAALCRAMGQFNKNQDWLMLSDQQRKHWMENGPKKSFPRRMLFEHIEAAIEYLCDTSEPPVSMRSVREVLALLKAQRDKPGKKPKVVQEMLAALEGEGAE